MRSMLLLALCACGQPASALPADALAPGDGPEDAALAEREVRKVLVGDHAIIWTHGTFPACPADFGCVVTGPAVTVWDRTHDRLAGNYEGGVGSLGLAGAETAYFVVAGPDFDHMYLSRMGGDPVVNLSLPRALTTGPAVDARYVYWADSVDYRVAAYTIRRALRDGDGTDATEVVTLPVQPQPQQLTYAAGYLWWVSSLDKLQRVPASGGAIEDLPTSVQTLAAFDDVVYAGRSISNGDGTWTSEVGRFRTDGSFERLAVQSLAGFPRYLVQADHSLYWSVEDGNVYRVDLTGGAIETIAAHDRMGYAFAVLPDRLLVEFTRSGFRSVPR